MAKVGELPDLGANFFKRNLHFFYKKNGIFGGRIPWSLTIIVDFLSSYFYSRPLTGSQVL